MVVAEFLNTGWQRGNAPLSIFNAHGRGLLLTVPLWMNTIGCTRRVQFIFRNLATEVLERAADNIKKKNTHCKAI